MYKHYINSIIIIIIIIDGQYVQRIYVFEKYIPCQGCHEDFKLLCLCNY